MYSFALAGCGRISKNHIDALAELEKEGRAKLLACCDPVADRACAVAERTGCQAFPSIGSMLDAVRADGVGLNTIESWRFADSHPMDDEVEQANTNPPSVYGFGHLPYYRHVADVLDGTAEPLLTGREGRKSVEIIEAAYESSRTGSVVAVQGRARR